MRRHRWFTGLACLALAMTLGTMAVQAAPPHVPPPQGERWLPFDGTAAPSPPTLTLLAADANTIALKADLPGCMAADVTHEGQVYTRLYGDGYGFPAAVGLPSLPVLRRDVEIPFGAEVTLELVQADYRDYPLAELGLQTIYPLQPPVPKIPGAQDRPLTIDKAFYQGGSRYPSTPLSLGERYIVRGHRVQTVEVWPVAYDPGAGTVRLYREVTFRLRLSGSDMARTQALAERYASPAFESRLAKQIFNYNQGRPATRFAPDAEIGYLIIAADDYYDAMLPLVALRESRGYDVTMVRCSEIGGCTSTANVKAYIQNAYDNWPLPPSYVLLVGDTDTIATWIGPEIGTSTDLYYGTMDPGDDWHPDIGRGRFPVRSAEQTTIMVDKYLAYADLTGQEPWVKTASFPATCDQYLIAEGTHNYVIDTHTAPAGYTGNFPNPGQPGGDKLYCITYGATHDDLVEMFNQGRWAIIYSGHGGYDGWEMNFTSSDVQNLANYGTFPFVASHACLSGDFGQPEVFGETWVLQDNKGALVYWGSSTYSYWDEDDVLERRMFDSLFSESEPNPTTAQMTDDGLDGVEAVYPSSARYYRETYNVLGDPAVKIFLEPELPMFTFDVIPAEHEVCGSETVTSSAVVGSIMGYSKTVYLEADAPAGIVATLDPISAQAPFTAELTLEVSAPAGDYTVIVTATDQVSYTESALVTVHVASAIPDVPTLVSPTNGAVDVPRANIMFDWDDVPEALSYQLQVDDDPAFGSPEADVSGIRASAYTLAGPLVPATTYHWRVRASNGCGEGDFATPFSFTTKALSCILLVDDDEDDPDVRAYYTGPLDSLGYSYDVWDLADQGNPQFGDLSGYQAIIWFTGYPWGNTFTPDNEAAVAAYLDAGGNFFLSSEDYLYDFGLTPFGSTYLGISTFDSDNNETDAVGNAGNPVGGGLGPYYLTPPAGWSGSLWTDYAGGAESPFRWQGSGQNNSTNHDGGTYRTVFFAWPYEGIAGLSDRSEVMEAIIAYFGGCACDPVHNANFTWEPLTPLVGQDVHFTGSAAGDPPISYAWDFGDGNLGNGQYPTHAYANPGDYTVVMTATNCETATATMSHTITVQACELADPTFTWTPPAPAVDQVITFTATVTGTPPISLSWDFDDGTFGTGATITHVYTLPGFYDVVLTAENDCASKTVTNTLEVTCESPEAAIASDSPVELGQPMHFTSTVTGDGPFTYAWDFGDGLGASADPNPVYTYTAAGDFTVTLVVEGRCGTDTVTLTVTVMEACLPPAAAIASDSPVELGQPMHFTSTVTGDGPFTYAWDFGDGLGASADPNPVYTYTAAGDFTVTLTVTGACGVAGDETVVTVVAPPEEEFLIYLPILFKDY